LNLFLDIELCIFINIWLFHIDIENERPCIMCEYPLRFNNTGVCE